MRNGKSAQLSAAPGREASADGDELAPRLPGEATVTSAHGVFTENCGNVTLQELQFQGQGWREPGNLRPSFQSHQGHEVAARCPLPRKYRQLEHS